MTHQHNTITLNLPSPPFSKGGLRGIWVLVFLSYFLSYPDQVFSSSLTLSGSYKSLLMIGETLSKEDYWSDLNRLRLEIDIKPVETILIKTVYDNEAIIGTLLKTGEFAFAKEAKEATLFDLSREITDNQNLFWRHSLYRLYLTYSKRGLNLTVGRQRVAWGQARIWNPTDLFNPVSPLRIEREQRTGVDAVNIDYSFGPLAGLNIVYAPGNERTEGSAGARVRTNIKGYDLSIMTGEFRKNKVMGLDFAGNIGDSGFRGEGVFTDQKEGRDFSRLVLSWDYNFPGTLYLLLEYLNNGGNLGRDASPLRITQFSGEIVTRNRNFLASGIGYDLTPLARFDLYGIYDIDAGSLFLNPEIRYNIRRDLDWVTGSQIFSGNEESEYGPFPDTYYTSLEWYF